MHAYLCAWGHECMRTCVHEDLNACVSVCVGTGMLAYLCAWGSECMRICVHGGMNACVSVCVGT